MDKIDLSLLFNDDGDYEDDEPLDERIVQIFVTRSEKANPWTRR